MLTPTQANGQLSMAWNAAAGAAAPLSYVLLAGSAPGRADLASFDLGSPATAFVAAPPPDTYFLRVAARNACGVGAVSNEVVASVSATGGGGGGGVAPIAPDNTAASVSGRIVSLSWSAPATGPVPTSYQIDVGSTSGAVNVASFDTGSAATSLSGTVPPGRYFIRVRTRVGTLVSPPSSEVSVLVP